MNSLLLSSGLQLNIIFDIVIAAIIVLYFLWGFFKGFAKPLTGIISWGIIVAVIYFGGNFIGGLFMDAKYLNLDAIIRPWMEMLLKEDAALANIDIIMKYVGLILAAVSVTLVVKIITFIVNIFIKKARKPYKKTFLDRFFGALLNLIKGAFVVCILFAIIEGFSKLGISEITSMIEGSTLTKYVVQYNPVTMLFKAIIK